MAPNNVGRGFSLSVPHVPFKKKEKKNVARARGSPSQPSQSSFVRKHRKSWLAYGSLGGVTIFTHITFHHIRGASEV